MNISASSKRLPRWAVLLLALVLSLGITVNFMPAQNLIWLEDRLPTFATVFLSLFIEAAPFLLLGTLASGLVEVFVDRGELTHWLPRDPVRAVLTGCVLGLIFPVCECALPAASIPKGCRCQPASPSFWPRRC